MAKRSPVKKALKIDKNKLSGLIVALVVVGVGVYLLASSHAATSSVSLEAEAGSFKGTASAQADTSASGGHYVQFGNSNTYSCITSDFQGQCNFPDYSEITGTQDDPNPYVGANVWSGNGNYKTTLYANSPSDWYITANVNTDFGGVQAYSNGGWHMSGAIDSYKSITSSWNVTIPTDTSKVAGWAAYDLWFNNTSDEVMIQTDITANSFYDCTAVVTATFDGMPWHMCAFGSERVWKPGTDDNHLQNQTSGTVDILAILKYMENNMTTAQDKLPSGSTWTTDWGSGSFGFEVCDTEGTTQTFRVNDFTWHAQ